MSTLTLKWGTLKAWDFNDDSHAIALLDEYSNIGMSMGAASQRDTPRQKEIICELIDRCTTPVFNDWDGVDMGKDDAKAYVMNYGHARANVSASDSREEEPS